MTYHMPKRPKSVPSLAIAVAKCGVRGALRPFLRHPDTCFVAILVVPDGMTAYYEHAAAALLKDPGPLDSNGNETVVVMSAVNDAYEGRLVYNKLKYARRVVMVVNSLDNLLPELNASADHTVTVARPTSLHYLAAASEIGLQGMTQQIAELLAPLSFDTVTLAVRPGRPLLNSVRYLRRRANIAQASAPVLAKPSAIKLENMSGYGRARHWGLELAQDIESWRRGEIVWEDVDRGALLFGPPGCGKTTYARALAGSCDVELVVASAARWQAKGHLGDYLKAMRASFETARKKSPSILFIDEFDSVGSRETHAGSDHHDYKRQAINALLECLDPSEGREGVVVVGATNDPDAIDPALLRPGRLEVRIEIPLPNEEARVAILKQHLGDHRIDEPLQSFVAVTRGWSGADIEKLARDARRLARRRRIVMSEDLLLAALPTRRALSEEERRRTAVHEAGHAIVGVLLSSDVLMGVYIEDAVPDHGVHHVLGQTQFARREGGVRTLEFHVDRIAMLLGGIAAEILVYGNHSDGAGGVPTSDLALASDLATMIERHYGLGKSLTVNLGKGARPLEYLRDGDTELRRLVDARLETELERAKSILAGRRSPFEQLVEMLLRDGRVEGDAVRTLVSSP